MTPGIHPIKVSSMFRKNAPPSPRFMNTATGGNKMLNMIVNNDIVLVLVLSFNN